MPTLQLRLLIKRRPLCTAPAKSLITNGAINKEDPKALFWVNEAQLLSAIELQPLVDSNNNNKIQKTARELLPTVFRVANQLLESQQSMILNREEKRYRALGLKIDMQEHGDKRWFTDADGEKRQYRPRWFWIGPKRLHNKVSVKDQLWYYKVLSGAKQQVRDEDSRKRRKAGHMDWVLGNDTFEREEFESKELRPILDKIREKKKAHAHLEEIDIEDMLKLIAINSFFPEEESESMIDQQEEGEQQEAPMFHDPLSQDGILPPEVSPSPPKRPRLSEPDEDDPGEARWKLEYLRTLNGKRLAYLELLHFVASQESDVNHDDPVERSQAMDNNIKDITGKKLELASFSETMVSHSSIFVLISNSISNLSSLVLSF